MLRVPFLLCSSPTLSLFLLRFPFFLSLLTKTNDGRGVDYESLFHLSESSLPVRDRDVLCPQVILLLWFPWRNVFTA